MEIVWCRFTDSLWFCWPFVPLLYSSFIKQSSLSPVSSKLSWWPSVWHFIRTFSSMNSEGCFQPHGPHRHVWEVNGWEDTGGSSWYSGGDCQSGCLPLQRLCQLGVGCGECALTLWERTAVSSDCSSSNSFPQDFSSFSYSVSEPNT